MTTRQESTSNTTAVRTTTPSSGKPSPSLWILGLFLFFAAYVNLNDPDFYFWTPAYGLGGALSWYALLRTNTNGTTANNSTTSNRIRRNIYKTYLVMSLAVSLGSFSLLWSESTHYRMSGKSDAWWLGALELEPVREGGGSLLMALAMYLCLPPPEDSTLRGTSHDKITSTTRDLILTTSSGIVAAVAIYLGVILPQYYARLGVAIPEHCGGAAGGSEAEPDNNNPFLASS